MSGEISISTNTLIAIAIIMVLVALFFVFVKIIQLLNELIATVKRSHTTIDHVDVVLADTSSALKSVEPMIGDVHEKYFAISESITKATNFVSGLTSRSSRKKDDQ